MKVYNTLTRQKEEFIPREAGKVKMYVCGPTVYDYIHIGNARPYVVFDTVRRYLEYKGYDVTYVQNFTDVDDKIINRANQEGSTMEEISNRFIEEAFHDADGLNVKRATVHPRVTQEMDGIIEMVQTLIDKGYAYEVDGTVYYDTKKFPEYGKLSKKNLNELIAGASERVQIDDAKRNSTDFVLWKPKKEGEPSWPSPWGDGRPGWHIECSVMAKHHLGDTIDIHAGGEDLIFPHHENEIAQSEAANGCQFAKYWLHNGFITVDNEKMSKSLGNFFTVRDIAAQFPYEVIRFFILNGHYRSPINFSRELMQACQNGLERIKNARKELDFYIHRSGRTGRGKYTGICYSLYDTSDEKMVAQLEKKGIQFKNMEIRNGQLVDLGAREKRKARKKQPTALEMEIQKIVKKPTKVKPGYRKKRKQQIEALVRKQKRQIIQQDIRRQKKERARAAQIAKRKEEEI